MQSNQMIHHHHHSANKYYLCGQGLGAIKIRINEYCVNQKILLVNIDQ
jgi:hypothetical protein